MDFLDSAVGLVLVYLSGGFREAHAIGISSKISSTLELKKRLWTSVCYTVNPRFTIASKAFIYKAFRI